MFVDERQSLPTQTSGPHPNTRQHQFWLHIGIHISFTPGSSCGPIQLVNQIDYSKGWGMLIVVERNLSLVLRGWGGLGCGICDLFWAASCQQQIAHFFKFLFGQQSHLQHLKYFRHELHDNKIFVLLWGVLNYKLSSQLKLSQFSLSCIVDSYVHQAKMCKKNLIYVQCYNMC